MNKRNQVNKNRLMLLMPSDRCELNNLYQLVKNCFYLDRLYDVKNVDSNIFILINESVSKEEIVDTAIKLLSTVNSEIYIDLLVGISESFPCPIQITEALADARQTIEIGTTYYAQKHIFFSDELKTEKMLQMISEEERKKMYNELFKHEKYDNIEEETYRTIESLLKNNLNMGDTAKELYIHRNTLTYRLDKINKDLGLNLKDLNDVMLYKTSRLLKRSLIKKKVK
ncbi:MAG: PucR family transcriptional regulator [Alkaliphilus sp.]